MGKTNPIKKSGPTIAPLSPAHLVGLGALQLCLILLFINTWLALVPLLVFALVCLAMPFLPKVPFYLPTITHGDRRSGAIALTFDDGPYPETTPALLALLKEHKIHAAFFVIGQQAEKHPDLIRQILEEGHEIGNHSMRHDPLLMLKSSSHLKTEIDNCQKVLGNFGVRPLTFRPPIGIVSPRLWRPLIERGMRCVCFNNKAHDRGNRNIEGLASKILGRISSGDIILLHDRPPANEKIETWLAEVETLIHGIKAKNLGITGLSELIGVPVMEREGGACDPVRSFYNGLAKRYDEEQETSGMRKIRELEMALAQKLFSKILSPDKNVLEIGAGSGRFTLPIASVAGEVTAVELSGGMLAVLKQKAQSAGVNNILTVCGDIREISPGGSFDAAFSFSALEYIPDLLPLFKQIARLLEPGGHFYFITAHRSTFRLFTQIGNAMRQGVWLHARSKDEIRHMLEAAGFEVTKTNTHGLKNILNGGILLEVIARKR